jgi:cytochrome c-type biogenesis protein CcmH/NrfF
MSNNRRSVLAVIGAIGLVLSMSMAWANIATDGTKCPVGQTISADGTIIVAQARCPACCTNNCTDCSACPKTK